jgi:ankyrin repeat protein
MIRDNYGNTALHTAAANNRKNVAEVLVSKGAEINVRGSNGAMPLHTAASWGNKDMVEFSVAKGAEINAKNENGLTPLGLAIKNKQDEVANYLRKQGGGE